MSNEPPNGSPNEQEKSREHGSRTLYQNTQKVAKKRKQAKTKGKILFMNSLPKNSHHFLKIIPVFGWIAGKKWKKLSKKFMAKK